MSWYKHLPPASLVKHVLILVPCCVQAPVSTRVSNAFWIKVSLSCVHASLSPSLCSERVWIVDLSPCTHIRLQPCSNLFDYGGLFVYPSRPHQNVVTPELEKNLQTHEVFLCGFLHFSRYRADLSSGMSIMQRFKLLASRSARFVRDALLRPSSTQGVELFFPLFSKGGVCQLSSSCDLP